MLDSATRHITTAARGRDEEKPAGGLRAVRPGVKGLPACRCR